MSRTPHRLVPRLEWLEDRSVPSVSPVNARLALAPLDRPDKVEVVETIQRLNDVADSRPALQATLNQLNAGETVALVNAIASADTVNAKVIRDIVDDIRDGETPDTGEDDARDERSPRQLSKVEPVSTTPTTPLLGLLTATLRTDLTLPTLTLSPVATPTAAPTSAEARGEETLAPTLTPPQDEARPKAVAVVKAVSPGTAQEAELIAVEEPAGVVTAASEAEVVAAPSQELMAARLSTDGSGLEAFVASLDRFGQALGLPEGASLPSWVVAAALALATCEVARRQSRAARRALTLTPADDTDTLSWSLTTP